MVKNIKYVLARCVKNNENNKKTYFYISKILYDTIEHISRFPKKHTYTIIKDYNTIEFSNKICDAIMFDKDKMKLTRKLLKKHDLKVNIIKYQF